MAKKKAKKPRRTVARARQEQADADGVASRLLVHVATTVRDGLGDLQTTVDSAAADVHELLAALQRETDPAMRSVLRKELRDARSHLAWLARNQGALMGEVSRAADRDRKHTGRISVGKVLAWARQMGRGDLEMFIDQLSDILAQAASDETTSKDGGLLS